MGVSFFFVKHSNCLPIAGVEDGVSGAFPQCERKEQEGLCLMQPFFSLDNVMPDILIVGIVPGPKQMAPCPAWKLKIQLVRILIAGMG